VSFLHAGVIERLLVRLFATSSKFFIDWMSIKLFNDAIDIGLVDTLAGTIDVAVRALNGADPTAALFESPGITVDNISKVLNSPNMTVAGAALIFNSSKLSPHRAARILNSPEITIAYVKSILAHPNVAASRVQAILYAMADQGLFDRLMNLFTFDRTDATYTTSTTLATGVNFLRNVSVASGVTLTLGASPCVLVADTLTNSGTITTNVVKGAGGAPSVAGVGAGGDGLHGIIVLARSVSVGTIRADGRPGGDASSITTSGAGNNGTGGLFWEISGYPAGMGGKGAHVTRHGGAGSKNAGGGGAFDTVGGVGGGAGGAATVITFASPTDLLRELFKTVADLWIVNVLGKSPTTTKPSPALGGSGGGSGLGRDGSEASGGGGGGGGQIIIYGNSVTAGTVTAVGGRGGHGGAEGGNDCGGGGGGGGIVYVFYKSLTGTFSFNVAGGAAGTGDYTGQAGSAGSATAFAI
jgi:hypothetical protein